MHSFTKWLPVSLNPVRFDSVAQRSGLKQVILDTPEEVPVLAAQTMRLIAARDLMLAQIPFQSVFAFKKAFRGPDNNRIKKSLR
ncbi:MAG: hypothetical protein P8010_02125 [Desulfosarcinaceae bacterium]|jgi:hypothetical protein